MAGQLSADEELELAAARWWWETEADGGLTIVTDLPEFPSGLEITGLVGVTFRSPHPDRLSNAGLAAGGECIIGAEASSWVWYWTMEHDRRHTIDEANRRKKDSDPRPPRVREDPRS